MNEGVNLSKLASCMGGSQRNFIKTACKGPVRAGMGSWATCCWWNRQTLHVAHHSGEQHWGLLKPKGGLGCQQK